MGCTTGCPTPGAHSTWGACARAKRLHVGDVKGRNGNKKWDADLQAYADARRQGIQPAGTERHHVDRAVRISEADGKAWQA